MSYANSLARSPSLATQIAMVEFMASGLFEAHDRKMRPRYLSRQNALNAVSKDIVPDLLDTEIIIAALHVIGYLPQGYDDTQVARPAKDLGLSPPLVGLQAS